jgi:CPA1 family monovalent cation:H+ antiporter
MRGTVTLATALALPTDFPQRDLILFTAFAVTLGTLVIQGFTLKPMLLWLRLRDDGQVDRELLLARFESLKAAVDAIASCEATETTRYVQQGFAMQLRQAEQDYKQAPSNTRRDEGIAARVAVEEQRRRLRALRAQGTIGDVAYQQLESELDWMELGWEQALRPDNPNSKLS